MGGTHWFLRYESKMLSVFFNIEFRDGLVIKKDISGQRIVESLDELDTEQPISDRKTVSMDGLTLYSCHNHWHQQERHMCPAPQIW